MDEKKSQKSTKSTSFANIGLSTKSNKKRSFRSSVKLISLSSLVLTVILTILQIYLIVNRFRLIKDLSINFSQTSSSPILSNQQKLNNSIIINTFLLTFSLLFTIFYLITGALRLGIYSHDNFKLGKTFDESKTKSDDFIALKNNNLPSPCSTSMASDDSARSVSLSKQRLTKSSAKSSNSCFKSIECCSFRKPDYWSELPPIGVCFHLLSALFLLIAEVQLTSKRIQLGNKPIGDIFSSKLDFLIGEPINRLRTFRSSQIEKTRTSTTIDYTSDTKNEAGLSDIFNSRDDFSVFGSINIKSDSQNANIFLSSLVFSIASNTISLDYLNFIIALILFMIKLSQTFWSSSKKFTFLIFFYNLIVMILMSISYCSFEIIFKSNNLKAISKKFLFFGINSNNHNKQDYSTANKINLMDDYGHDLVSVFLFVLTSYLLFFNSYLIAKFGYRKFNAQRNKFEINIINYLVNNNLKNKLNDSGSSINESNFDDKDKNTINEISLDKSEFTSNSSTKSPSGSSSSSLNSIEDSENNKKVDKSKSKTFNYESYCSFAKSFRENIISSVLFLIYCLIRSLFIYELFVVFNYTYDILFIWSIILELVVILVWIVTLGFLTIKDSWSFKIDSNYKLIYWNWLYHFKALRQIKPNVFISTSETRILLNTSLNSQKNSLHDGKTIHPSKKTTTDMNHQILADSIKNINENQMNNNKTPGLLVRDDSVLNRSSYLSSSSITEVSSLMASTFANNINQSKIANPCLMSSIKNNNNSNMNSKQSSNILNVSSLGSAKLNRKSIENLPTMNIAKDHKVVVTDDDENQDNNFKKIQLNRSNQNLKSQTLFAGKTNNLIENDIENIQQYNQIQNFILDGVDDENEKEYIQSMPKKRSYSCRPSNIRNTTLGNNSLKTTLATSNTAIATIGEIMEDNMNQSQINSNNFSNNKNCPISVIHKSINIIDSASSSSATVDSGRDSILESPINNSNNLATPSQIFQNVSPQMMYNQNAFASMLNKPFTHESKTSYNNNNNSQTNKKKNQTVQLIQSSNLLLDTNC